MMFETNFNMRTIKRVIDAAKVNMGGIYLDQPLPYSGIDQIDPFLLVHHWKSEYKGGQFQKDIGVGPHPHRGFAPVTFIFEGGVLHQDSEGNRSEVLAGGTQWMNSGSGIVHSERPIKKLAENGGNFEIIQFWVNAPAARKMDKPSYQSLSYESTPNYLSEDKKVKVGVVAGEVNGVSGKISPYSDLLALRLDIEAGGKVTIPIPEHFNAFVYQLNGNLTINGVEKANDKQLIWFNNDGKEITIEGESASRAILLSGAPINEKISTYGPFVMNTQREIIQALNDFQSGKMGKLIEKFD